MAGGLRSWVHSGQGRLVLEGGVGGGVRDGSRVVLCQPQDSAKPKAAAHVYNSNLMLGSSWSHQARIWTLGISETSGPRDYSNLCSLCLKTGLETCVFGKGI